MPTILRFGAFRVMIYTDDHAPPHVHVSDKGGLIVFVLDENNRTVSIREEYDVSKGDARLIADYLESNIVILMAAWRQLHGE